MKSILVGSILIASALHAQQSDDVRARAIMARAAAVTNPKKTKPPQYTHRVVETGMGEDGPKARIEFFIALPDKILIRSSVPGVITTESGFDGKTGWSNSPETGPILLTGEALADLKAKIGSPTQPSTPGVLPIDSGTILRVYRDTVAGHEVDAILTITAGVDSSVMYFDPPTGRVSGMKSIRYKGVAVDSLTTFFFTDYKELGGSVIPTTTIVRMRGRELVSRVVALDHNPIASTTFAPPAALTATAGKP